MKILVAKCGDEFRVYEEGRSEMICMSFDRATAKQIAEVLEQAPDREWAWRRKGWR